MKQFLAGSTVYSDDIIRLIIRLYTPISKSFKTARGRRQKDEVGKLTFNI